MTVADPALIAYSFAALDPRHPHGTPLHAYLHHLWESCSQIGLTSESESLGVSADFPEIAPRPGDWFRILAARERPGAGARCRAFLFVKHDVIGFAARLTLPDASPDIDAWSKLYDEWDSASLGRPDGLLGDALIFTAASTTGYAEVPSRLEHDVESAFPCGPIYAPFVTDQGVVLWEGERKEQSRVFAAVGSDEWVTHWLWWSGDRELADFPRCLIYSSKLYYEFDIYRTDMSLIRQKQRRVDTMLDDLLDLHRLMDTGTRVRSDSLVDAQSRLSRAETETAGLLITVTRLREMQQTVEIQEGNLRRLMPPPSPGASAESDPFSEDLALAQWLRTQVDSEIQYSEAVRERARETRALTALRLEQVSAEHARRENQLTLLQTTVLGSLLSGLAVIEALNIQIDLSNHFKLPMVGLIMALALAMPPLIVNWYEEYQVFDLAASMLLGAAVSWFVAAIAWRNLPGGAAGGIAAAGGVAFLITTRWIDKKTSRHAIHHPEAPPPEEAVEPVEA